MYKRGSDSGMYWDLRIPTLCDSYMLYIMSKQVF